MTAVWIKANKKALIVLNSLAFIGSVYYFLSFKLVEIFVLLPFVLATLFYVFPFKNKVAGLRNVPGLKLFLISITWTGLTLYLPLFSAEFHNSEQLYASMAQRFLFVLAITIPFDIRDAQFDLPGLNTIPQVLGVNKSKMIAILALVIVVMLDTSVAYEDSNSFGINFFIMGLSMMMIAFSGPQRRRFYTAFWIEALPILWYLLYLVFIE